MGRKKKIESNTIAVDKYSLHQSIIAKVPVVRKLTDILNNKSHETEQTQRG